MKSTIAVSFGLALAGIATAAPLTSSFGQIDGLSTRAVKTAAEIVGEIAPNSKTCANSDECRTNEQAGPLLAKAMAQYKLDHAGPIAAVLALTAFESVDYQYKHNVFPGRAGQGTSNMQMYDYNKEYAESLKLTVPAGDTDAGKNALLDILKDDKYNFGSGPWFLTVHCNDQIENLKTATDEAFTAYMSCVGVTVDEGRKAYWQRAKTAFGL
ncbi:hypothetical protein F4802DRAFT_567155 [Xylaria palmicola]|nr:hypothetical protein F4802DRAFT_567155 [Xylaria palmicola]